MSRVDVRDLAKEPLAAGRFPVDPHADFRLYIAPEVQRGIVEHAKQDVTVEICGVLVGRWERDECGPYAAVANYIRCNNAASKLAEVTFTHESWAQINKEMDTQFAQSRIIGWYHSHPDFGIFLSDRDCFIQEHFFSGPGQVAYVVDPVRDLEGVFAWHAGKPQPLAHYWVGNKVRTVEASVRKPDGNDATRAVGEQSVGAATAAGWMDRGPTGLAMTLLTWLCIFLLGYFYAGLLSRWQQQLLEEGAVARFGVLKVLKPGLEDSLSKVRLTIAELTDKLQKLPDTTQGLTEDQQKASAIQRHQIAEGLAQCASFLEKVEKVYGLSDSERYALQQLMIEKQAEAMASAPNTNTAAQKPPSDATSSKVPNTQGTETGPKVPTNDNRTPSSDAGK